MSEPRTAAGQRVQLRPRRGGKTTDYQTHELLAALYDRSIYSRGDLVLQEKQQRVDSEALRAALERIMEAHHRDPDGGMGYTGNEYGTIKDACVVCGTSDEYAVPWPCWTYEQARAALTPEAEDDATNA
jgi:hypothetical protein